MQITGTLILLYFKELTNRVRYQIPVHFLVTTNLFLCEKLIAFDDLKHLKHKIDSCFVFLFHLLFHSIYEA